MEYMKIMTRPVSKAFYNQQEKKKTVLWAALQTFETKKQQKSQA